MNGATDIISSFTPGIEPLMKGGKIVEKGYIRGVATSERRDLQNEVLRRDGAVVEPFAGAIVKGAASEDVGAVTLEHPAGVFNPIGEPVDIEKGVTAKGDPCFFLTTKLWVDDEPLAAQVWDKVLRIQKASSRVRLGYSVEGKALKRNADDPKIIDEWLWVNTVVTGSPRNRDAFFDPILASALAANPKAREYIAKAIGELGEAPAVKDFADLMLPGHKEVNGVAVDEVLNLGRLAEKLNMNAVDLAVGAALKGSAAWKDVLAKIMQRIAAGL
jgi:hypothetical protein